MSNRFDEFSKSLASRSFSRRHSMRLLGAALAGSLLDPFGMRSAAAARRITCKDYCNKCPKARRQNCINACNACGNDPSRLCTDCWNFACCETGESCCENRFCRDLADDFDNCGACLYRCESPGPFETGACVDGKCKYWCVQGAVLCNGECSLLDRDPSNCGACCVVCPAAAPLCSGGTCQPCPPYMTNCGGYCADLLWDSYNCGACGFVCPGTPCVEGACDFGF